MLRRCLRTRRRCCVFHPRRFSSSSFSSCKNSVESPNNLNNTHPVPSQSPQPQIFGTELSTLPSKPASLSQNSVFFLSATLLSTLVASVAVISANKGNDASEANPDFRKSPLYDSIEQTVYKSNESFKRIVHHAKQTGVAASVLWQSLRSVMSSANHEVRVGFELRVASLLSDIAAANAARRAAIVSAGGGAVVDWLLEKVAVGKTDVCGTQSEAARALAYLIADPDVRKEVLGRPRAVPNLLRFIFSCQPQNKSKRPSGRSSFDISDSLKGRSMLVAAIMDIVTSNCDSVEKVSFKHWLPGNAEMRDIAAAIEVIEEGGMHLDEGEINDDDDDGGGGGGRGMKGIGIKILEGTTVLGLSRTSELMELDHSNDTHGGSDRGAQKTLARLNQHDSSVGQANLSAAVVPGLWDDLHCQHVAVPFAAWALANWAMASEINRSHIEELDQDGEAVMTALLAPERSVKFHGSLVARLLLEDYNLPLNDSVSDWASSLLSTASHASRNDDISLSQMALSAFIVAVERSPEARRTVMEKGLELMRVTAKRTAKHQQVQEALAKALELLSTEDMHLSLDESQKWSSILLSWVFGKSSSNAIQSSAIKILSCILEDHGPSSIPISQGWLALLLNDVLSSSKASSVKGGKQPNSDKVKTQIEQSNILSAAQTSNQLAVAVVNLAGKQLAGSVDTFPLEDLLSLEPFTGPFKNLKKDNLPKFDVADSALATLKGIKALTEICAEDSLLQDKITSLGVLCLLRRYLLRDDYEKLAAMEAYAASRAPKAQERVSSNADESSPSNTNDPSSVRVPPTAHIRKHAARLLTILSLLPKVQKVIAADETWCKWLEDCANGKISGISDLKIRSSARAILLNVFCSQRIGIDSVNSVPETSRRDGTNICPRYDDMIFLINPELPHWKCPGKDQSTDRKDKSFLSEVDSVNGDNAPITRASDVADSSSSIKASDNNSESEIPAMDIVFVHGLRGGPYKTWRIAEDKSSTKSGLVEKIDEEAGKLGTFWPGEWLSADFPHARLFSLKYKTNLTQWSGASLPLQEVSFVLLKKLVAAGIGNRPVVFVTHSMGGLVVKQILYKAKEENMDNLVNNTIGVVFYSCPHFGSKLADMPWRMGLVLRPAPSIGELRSDSPRLVELNDFLRRLHKKQMLQVLSFCETKVTPIVEGYGGWAFRMEIVPIESAYPGFGELVVLESTDHINSCKPLSHSDPSYTEVLEFLSKLKAQYT